MPGVNRSPRRAAALTAPAAAVLAVVLLTSCGAAGERPAPTREAAATATTPAPEPSAGTGDPCALLSTAQAESLLGEVVTATRHADVGGLPACQMGGAHRWIQVARVPASAWAETLPGVMEQVRSAASGLGEDNIAKLDEMIGRMGDGEFDDLDACELFTVMVEFNGAPQGSLRVVNYVPDGVTPQAVTAQSCVDGTYATVLLAGPDIVAGAEVESAMEEALAAAGGTSR